MVKHTFNLSVQLHADPLIVLPCGNVVDLVTTAAILFCSVHMAAAAVLALILICGITEGFSS